MNFFPISNLEGLNLNPDFEFSRFRLNFRVKNPQNQPRNAHYLRYSLNAVLVKFISVELEIGLFIENPNFRSKTPENNHFCQNCVLRLMSKERTKERPTFFTLSHSGISCPHPSNDVLKDLAYVSTWAVIPNNFTDTQPAS